MQILAVVVRYKIPLAESQTVQGLCEALVGDQELADAYSVLIWDNSPEPLTDPQLPIPFVYRHSERNLGVSGAYNRALDVAESLGCPWILTLDQDTTLDATYLKRMLSLSREQADNSQVGSIVPFVRSQGQLVSPRRLGRLNRVFQIDRSFSGILHANAYAINSASLLRVGALREIGGYSEDFWLDLSDVYAFQRLHEQGKRIFVANDLELDHQIAGMNFEQDMVPERYRAFLAAENLYLALYRSRFENAFQTFRLIPRTIRQCLAYQNKKYAEITWRCLLFRLFTTRAKRLTQWRNYLANRRDIPSAHSKNSDDVARRSIEGTRP
jgi:GT2 family glycosyltransferase